MKRIAIAACTTMAVTVSTDANAVTSVDDDVNTFERAPDGKTHRLHGHRTDQRAAAERVRAVSRPARQQRTDEADRLRGLCWHRPRAVEAEEQPRVDEPQRPMVRSVHLSVGHEDQPRSAVGSGLRTVEEP